MYLRDPLFPYTPLCLASAASFSGPGHRDRPGGERRMGEGERSGADRNNAYPSPRTHIHRPERISVTPNAYLSSRPQRGICFIAGEGSSLAALGMTGTPTHEPVADANHRLLGHHLKAAAPVETHVPGRSEERRVGKEGVRTCRYRWAPDP